MSGDRSDFSKAMKRCGGMQRMYEAAKSALEAHLQDHGC
jgi:hypothetical protein